MNINAIGIPLTFIILASIGLWIILYSRGAWYFKLVFVFLSLYFSFLMWFSLSDLSGWATESKFPNKTVIHWLLVQEPSKTNSKHLGNIFIWATEVDDDNNIKEIDTNLFLKPFSSKKNNSEPRAYRLPYTEELHKKAAKAMQLIISGKTLVGEANADGGESENSTQNKPNKKNGNGSLSQEQIFRFYELPPTKLPSKITGSDN